ncbi:mannan endo-1,4-beta-mannosidase 6-like isoform X2 [Nymphaea colorata]|uniref:mannan endo-1,4-beta-mannosidase 6-like isoform X2 n=1 Tax=Nymphaea colorata TaxID=210225 RepID=UPI00129D2991|nr:mannan endo-1,4-beta-mannosidase 6-like isoform X2 [Nymphaea colorata]
MNSHKEKNIFSSHSVEAFLWILIVLLNCTRFCNCEELEDEEWAMVGRKGSQFVVNSRPFYVNGFNTYWLMIFAVDASTRGKVSEIFQQASSVGLSVCRTWAFNDGGWRALQKSPGVYDEDVFKGLDFVISEAKRYKIRLILSLSNNWEAYGGKAQYVKWGRSAGLNLTSDDDFFSDPTLKGYFKSHIKTVLTRVNSFTNVTYKDDPTIFAWELMNEPRCLSDPSGDQFQAWVEEISMYVKSIDQAHLLEIGSEGFYGPSSPDKVQFNPNTFAQQIGTDFLRNHKAFAIDFASAHIYADTWISSAISDAHLQFTKTWMESHINDAENALNMPILFSEFGVSSKDGGYNDSFRDTLINTVYSTLLSSIKKGGGGGGSLLWQLFPVGTEYMDDGYAVFLSKSPSTATIISLQSKRMDTFNSLCSWRCHWGCKKKKEFELFMHAEM